MRQLESLFVVQFLHPGGEHSPDGGGIKRWNTGDHRRKFLLASGRALRKDQKVESDLIFWGEWEPESELVEHFISPANGEPEYLWRPYFTLPDGYAGLQNTDPFVFGTFLYGICQQYRKGGPTQLRHLAPGSVILFGSCVNKVFAVDTVFVVRSWIDHERSTYKEKLAGKVPQEYVDLAVRPLYESMRQGGDSCAPDNRRSWRLYFGATCDDPYEGMFSFFPCRAVTGEATGFRRPTIRNPEAITDNLSQGFRLGLGESVRANTVLWKSVVDQVQGQDLSLGIYAKMPVRRDSPEQAAPHRVPPN